MTWRERKKKFRKDKAKDVNDNISQIMLALSAKRNANAFLKTCHKHHHHYRY